MADVVGGLLPLAVGVALSPVAIMVVIVLLVAPGGRLAAAAFVAGWLGGLVAVGGVVIALVDVTIEAEGGDPRIAGALVRLVLGAVLLVLAVRGWRGRPGSDDVPELPGWMRSLDGIPVPRALVLGATLGAVKPKNLALTAAAGAAIAEAGLAVAPSVALLLGYAVLATGSVAAPLVATVALGSRAPAVLAGWKTWLGANHAALTAGVLVVLGAVLLGQGLGGLG